MSFSLWRWAAIGSIIVAALASLNFEAFWLLRGTVGVDVSHHQKAIDWKKLARGSVAFAYIKATEGGDYVDDLFARNWQEAGTAGLARGAYHFFRACRSGAAQARNFISTVPRATPSLPPVIDVEDVTFCDPAAGGSSLETEISAFLDIVEEYYGCRPIIYTTPEFDRERLSGKLEGERYWVRSIFLPPQFRRQSWLIWQYHNAGRLDGVDGPVDLNVFRGSPEDFRQFAAGSCADREPRG